MSLSRDLPGCVCPLVQLSAPDGVGREQPRIIDRTGGASIKVTTTRVTWEKLAVLDDC